ncbi:MAG: efflux RND transporter periplasmic adaptor subunit [Gammaproteobacteria bacterium]|nr:efflux RND transporter periplasmic adaptor subunit [Gammaproteobacteria bacterium]
MKTITRIIIVILINIVTLSAAQALEISATLHWSKRVELGTPVNGVIKEVNVDIGQRIAKDTVLVSLDARGYRAAQSKARANVKHLKEAWLEAKRERDRAKELYERTVLSDRDLQLALNALTSAESAHLTAKAELVQAELNLEYSSLRAPFDAIVLKRNAEVGQTVVSELKPEVLVVIAASDQMIARGLISASHLNGDIHGQSATVKVDGLSYQGKVKHIGLEPVNTGKQDKHYEIEIVFTTGQRILRAGQQATINLP